MDRTDVLALTGAGLLAAGLGLVVFVVAGALTAIGIVAAAAGVVLLAASRLETEAH